MFFLKKIPRIIFFMSNSFSHLRYCWNQTTSEFTNNLRLYWNRWHFKMFMPYLIVYKISSLMRANKFSEFTSCSFTVISQGCCWPKLYVGQDERERGAPAPYPGPTFWIKCIFQHVFVFGDFHFRVYAKGVTLPGVIQESCLDVALLATVFLFHTSDLLLTMFVT